MPQLEFPRFVTGAKATTSPGAYGWQHLMFVVCLMFWGCDQMQQSPPADPVAKTNDTGWQVDTVGVRNIAEGDTINLDVGLTIIETTRIFPPEADGGEVFAWEFEARELTPVKLLLVRAVDGAQNFEILGESPMVVPRRLGTNRFELPEPIPLRYPCLFGIYMPEKGAIPFRKVRNWKTLISSRPFERPYIDRAPFSMYGWRYGARVFWRKPVGAETESDG
jgi:hypothetical protein